MRKQNESSVSTNSEGSSEFDQIGHQLDKLFVFQDKPLGKEKRSILVDALLESGMPIQALLAGIQGLMHEDLQTLKLGTILAAARGHVEHTEQNHCDNCNGGYFSMVDDSKYQVALACMCPLGQEKARVQGLQRWNGQDTQIGRGGRLLTRRFAAISDDRKDWQSATT